MGPEAGPVPSIAYAGAAGEFSKIVTASLDAGRMGIQRRADGLLEKR